MQDTVKKTEEEHICQNNKMIGIWLDSNTKRMGELIFSIKRQTLSD